MVWALHGPWLALLGLSSSILIFGVYHPIVAAVVAVILAIAVAVVVANHRHDGLAFSQDDLAALASVSDLAAGAGPIVRGVGLALSAHLFAGVHLIAIANPSAISGPLVGKDFCICSDLQPTSMYLDRLKAKNICTLSS